MLTMYVVYWNPTDYPEQYVVRRFDIVRGEIRAHVAPHRLSGSLTAARDSVPEGLTCLPRQVADEPQIVEYRDICAGSPSKALVIRFLVTTTSCAGVLAWDQVNLFGETPPIDTTYALASVILQDSRFTPSEMNRFLRACPYMLRNVMIVDHPRAQSAAIIVCRGGQLAAYADTYAHVEDWQTTRAQIPMAERVDGETSLRVILPMLAVARTFSIYATLERRR